MTGFNSLKINRIFSIPGRIRLKVENLRHDSNYAYAIETSLMKLSNINSVKANAATGNLLIMYNCFVVEEAALLNQITGIRITIHNFAAGRKDALQRKSASEMFREEKSLSKRFPLLSIAAASALLLSSSMTGAAAALVLGFPGIIYITSYLSFKYTLLLAERNEIYINKAGVIRNIQNLRGIFFHRNVIIDAGNTEHLFAESYLGIETMVANGGIEDPVHQNVRNLIKELRKTGINNLSVLNERNKTGLFVYAVKTLGLDDSGKHRYPEIRIKKDPFINTKSIYNGLALYVSENKNTESYNIYMKGYELYKIPWFIRICRRSGELLTISQVAAVSINTFGMMLIFTGYLNLGTSILLYLINMFGNITYLRHHILNSDKEIHHGEQRQLINA